MTDRPLRIGFVGAGSIARAHLENLRQIEGVEVVGVTDAVPENAARAARLYGGSVYPNPTALYDQARPDAVFICIPPFAHGEPELEAVRRGIPLFIEKPLGVDIERPLAIARAIEESGVLAAVDFHLRYTDSATKARELLSGRTVGFVQGWWVGGLPQTPWWRVMAQSGGQVVEQAVHIVDLARFLVGEIVEVEARYARRALTDVPNLDVPDVSIVHLTFADGAPGTLIASCLAGQGGPIGLDITCRDWTAEVRTDTLSVREVGVTHQYRFRVPYWAWPHLQAARAFLEAVRTGQRDLIRSPYSDALKTQAVVIAANRSAQLGRPVRVSEVLPG